MRWLRSLLIAFVMLATVGATLAPVAAKAAASDCQWVGPLNGRQDCVGFFTAVPYPFDDSWGNVLSGGMPASNVTEFVNWMNCYLNCATYSLEDHTGAAFLVDVMLGKNGPDFGCPNGGGGSTTTCRNYGIKYARDNFATWKKIVLYYSSKNLIDFSYDWTPSGSWYENSAMSSSLIDVTYHSKVPKTIPAIRFYDATTGSDMMIQKVCGNMLGDANRLNVPSYILSPELSPGIGTPAWGGTVTPGNDYYLTAYVENQSPLYATDAFQMEVSRVSGGKYVDLILPLGNAGGGVGSGTTGPLPAYAGYNSTCMYTPDFDPYGARTCWYWDYAKGASKSPFGYSTQASGVHFRLSAATPENTQVCFRIAIQDYNFGDQDFPRTEVVPGEPYCFTAHSPRHPSLSGRNGDIHAGGGIGDTCTGSGSVTGRSTAASYGEYVVSASAATTSINNFGATGSSVLSSPTNAAKLRFGKSGDYLTICRPDLVVAAAQYRAAGLGYNTTPLADFDVSGKSGVWYLDAAVTTVHGTVTDKLTLVGKTVVISGDIKLTTSPTADAHNLPSLGVITINDIQINKAATRVDAYLFANGDIDTCTEGASSLTACNTPLLEVNGFLMASGILFHRLGVTNSIGVVTTERVNLNPQIYLNPPKLFDSSVDDLILDGQGERQPLY